MSGRTMVENRKILLEIIYQQKKRRFSPRKIEAQFHYRTGNRLQTGDVNAFLAELKDMGMLSQSKNIYRFTAR